MPTITTKRGNLLIDPEAAESEPLFGLWECFHGQGECWFMPDLTSIGITRTEAAARIRRHSADQAALPVCARGVLVIRRHVPGKAK